jgi:hypothetical protein
MARLLAVIAGLALLGGCARQWAYDRPGVTEAERRRDAEECERSNAVPRVSRPFVFTGGRLVSFPFEGVDRHGYDLCMQGRGYTVTGN